MLFVVLHLLILLFDMCFSLYVVCCLLLDVFASCPLFGVCSLLLFVVVAVFVVCCLFWVVCFLCRCSLFVF